ncbi:MAG: nicotinate (nicotinamide) nucleotide adenylyltransferase [Candidatus Algichlamydia australiensis]|nr:nicotinate (nicotinamide) nucleotide adenylyltransferase [Chlamydiales bacterium]
MRSQSKIAFFGGSFDPVHLGHLNLIVSMRERWELDEIIISPVFCSPFKENDPPIASPEHRLKMCEIAFSDIPGVHVSDREVKRGGPSFTIESIETLYEDHKEKIFLILSEDVAEHLLNWKNAKKLLEISTPLICDRKLGRLDSLPLEIKKNITTLPLFEVSSTEVRARLKKKLYCRHLLPSKVLDYIYQNDLY